MEIPLWAARGQAIHLVEVTAGGLGGLPSGESAKNQGRISVMTGFRRRGVLIAASAIIIGAGIGAATLAAGAAHAQGSGSITITGVSTNGFGEAQFPVVTVSVTCPANDRFIVGASTMQSATSLGSTANAFCTGNAQTVTVNTTFPASSITDAGDGAGPVIVGATLQFVPPGTNFGNPGDTYVGTTANLTFP
jgi:hypothetical protein